MLRLEKFTKIKNAKEEAIRLEEERLANVKTKKEIKAEKKKGR